MCEHTLATAEGRLDQELGSISFHLCCDGCDMELRTLPGGMEYRPDPVGLQEPEDGQDQ